jgi:cytochrome b pre-mRNA-processing protein 3
MLARLWTKLKARSQAEPQQSWVLYHALSDLARHQAFYEDGFSVPDTLDGRFDLACVILGVACLHISDMQDGQGQVLSQRLFDHFFKQVELNLREGGVGDLSIPKQMRRMIQAFYGRMALIAEILQTSSELEQDLAGMLYRNIYTQDVDHAQALLLSQWIVRDYIPCVSRCKNMSQINVLIGDAKHLSQELSQKGSK